MVEQSLQQTSNYTEYDIINTSQASLLIHLMLLYFPSPSLDNYLDGLV